MWHGAGNALAAVVLAFAGGDADFDFVTPPKLPAGPPQSQAELAAAKAYLTDFGASVDAPRIAFDALMFAAVSGDTATADELRTWLIFERPESLQHRFLLTTLDAKAYRDLLVAAGKECDFTTDFSKRFCVAVGAGSKAWGATFLTDDAFLLQCGLAGIVANEKPLVEYCRTSLTKPTDSESEDRAKIRVASEILFDESLARPEKCLALHAIEDNDSARRLAEHFDSRLPDDLRDRADLVEARVERLLEHDGFEEALPIIEGLLKRDGDTPQRLFWRAWCEAATGTATAAEHFRDLAERHPDDAWAALARQAADGVTFFDRRVNEQADAAASAIRQAFAGEVQLVEARAEWTRKSGTISAYVFADLPAKNCEAILRQNEHWIAALRMESDRARLLLDGQPNISVFRGALPINIPQPNVSFDPIGRRFNLTMSATSNAQPPGESTATEASIALLRTLQPAMVRPVLAGYRDKGWLPLPVVENEGSKTYGWQEFSAREPRVTEWKVRLSSKQHIEAASGPSFAITDLKYGSREDFTPAAPAWPDLPVVEHAKFDPAIMFQAMAALTRLWSDESPAATAAAQSDAASRR